MLAGGAADEATAAVAAVNWVALTAGGKGGAGDKKTLTTCLKKLEGLLVKVRLGCSNARWITCCYISRMCTCGAHHSCVFAALPPLNFRAPYPGPGGWACTPTTASPP